MRDYSKESNKFYQRKAWKSCRESYIGQRILEDGGLCEICQDRVGVEVDHIIELNGTNINNPEIALSHDNLQFLCQECHNIKTHSESERLALFDNEGNPIFTEVKR